MDQPINERGDVIKNAQPDSWQKGACPPEWAQPTLLVFSGDDVLQFSDSKVLAFTEY